MLKLIIVAPKIGFYGMERALINFLNLSGICDKYEVTLLVGYIDSEDILKLLPKNINLEIMSLKWNVIGKLVCSIKLLLKLLNSKKYDISICYSHHHKILSKIARKCSKNSIIFIHAKLDATRNEEELIKLNKDLAFEKFSKVLCVSENALKSFNKIYPKINSTDVLYNFIDGDTITKNSEEKIQFKFDKNTIYLVNVSRHEEETKKISRIIDACTKIKNDNFKVLLIGDGENNLDYKKLVKEKSLENKIIFLGKMSNPYPYINKSNGVLISSKCEGYSIVIDEARVLNKTIITTDIGDAKKIINESNGILCKNSSDGVLKGIEKFLSKPFVNNEKFDYKKYNDDISRKLFNILNEMQEEK